ncbi:hypothetical protein Tco_1468824, partial [Tanacetum coccineum]
SWLLKYDPYDDDDDDDDEYNTHDLTERQVAICDTFDIKLRGRRRLTTLLCGPHVKTSQQVTHTSHTPSPTISNGSGVALIPLVTSCLFRPQYCPLCPQTHGFASWPSCEEFPVTDISKRDKNESKIDKIEHEIGKA